MRLWSLHPKYLDPQGLVALWREALLAQAVLLGKTKGYHHHPQLERFRAHMQPEFAISSYLKCVHEEALARGYSFDATKIGPTCEVALITVSEGQLNYEWTHLLNKLSIRNPTIFEQWRNTQRVEWHSLFQIEPGPIATWERTEPITSKKSTKPRAT